MLAALFLFFEKALKRDLDALQARSGEMSALAGEYRAARGRIKSIEGKGASAGAGGTAGAIDAIASSIGIKGRIKAIKAAGSAGIKGSMAEESVDVQIEKVTMNEMVNLFYSINNAPVILTVKQAVMKKSFESPDLLDVRMTVSLFTKK